MTTVFKDSAAEETQYGGEEVNKRDQRSESIRLQGRKRRNVWLVSRLSSCSSDPSYVGGFEGREGKGASTIAMATATFPTDHQQMTPQSGSPDNWTRNSRG
jgi:hypothetical protein